MVTLSRASIAQVSPGKVEQLSSIIDDGSRVSLDAVKSHTGFIMNRVRTRVTVLSA